MLANMQNFWGGWSAPVSILGFALGGIGLTILIIWSIYWKGLALWRAAHLNNKPWFVALLVINTLGVLEILYLYIFSKKKQK